MVCAVSGHDIPDRAPTSSSSCQKVHVGVQFLNFYVSLRFLHNVRTRNQWPPQKESSSCKRDGDSAKIAPSNQSAPRTH